MVWYTNQSLLLILFAFLLGLLVGYLLWGRRVRRVESSNSSVTATPATTTPEPVAAAAPQPVAAADPEPVAVAESEPVVAEPVVAEPVVAEPVAVADSEPAVPDPVAAPEPVLAAGAEPVVARPVAAAEAAAEPAFAAESESEPLVAEPVVAEPLLAEPVVAEPVVAAEPEPAAESELANVDAEFLADVESAFEAVEPAAGGSEPQDDDLERIEGIGPKIAAALRAAGIQTYAALADADRSTVENALDAASLRFAPSLGTWSRQARLLADGDEAGFKELTDRLIAGREVTPKAATVAPEPEPAEDEPVAVEPEPEPVVDEATAVGPEPEPVVAEAAAVAPDPVAVEPEPDSVVAEPVVDEPEPVVAEAAAVAPEPVAAEAVVVEPVVDEAVVVEPERVDDLKRIEGIGPKMSAALVAAGIRTYAQLADADVETLQAAIKAAGLRFAPSIVTWSRQARHLADSDEEGFADLTRRLVAGRDTGRP